MSNTKKQTVSFNYEAHYHTMGELNQNTRQIWFLCHGYGQLSKYFIQKFKVLNNGHNYLIAPGGLNNFYKEGFSGRVVATWMTKEERETDIKNYIKYLNSVYLKELQGLPLKNVKINILGFSQGVATVSRWVTQGDFHFDQLLLWAWVLPPDLDLVLSKNRLMGKNTYLIYGKNDPLIKEEDLITQNQLIEKLGIKSQSITFEGGHDINREVLKGFL
ncbi:alpha/beta hydrolase [Xanthovirga aplysinae]|uniref:alpha/beta hydrolase n=1 Tax=Xanthovirga aplysinae TaxID=2529853 RepID=UPI0012BCC135|nr:alpha/beta hydrolase [Xanthovirga aplysinae]MTI29539.1 alpha/beta hydrolase [Xanthovirga aplysinae]